MSTGIGSIGSNFAMMQSMGGMKRPDAAQMANELFSKLDSAGQGYITKSELQSALDQTSSSSSGVTSTSNADALFSKLDSNGDGKVTKDEFSATLKKVAEQLDNQFMSMRMSGGMPPPPPPGADAGFTKDQLTSQLSEIGSSDSRRSSTISDIINNFDKADTNGDGKVSAQEAMAYEQSKSSSASSASSTSTASTASTASTSSSDENAKLLTQIMNLMRAYNIGNEQNNSLLSSLSVSA